MTHHEVEFTDDPSVALDTWRPRLEADPINHNVMLTILHDRINKPRPGRYWWVCDDSRAVVACALQSPTTFSAALAPSTDKIAIELLASAMAGHASDLPGVIGEVWTAATFSGAWAEQLATPAYPHEGQRVYRLDAVRFPNAQPAGELRPATRADRDVLIPFALSFARDTGDTGADDPATSLDRWLDRDGLWVWDVEGEPRSMAGAARTVCGVSRIGFVSTPPEHRGRGYASACVAHLSQLMLATEASLCMLYTQLENPTSNKIYRALGYQSMGEVLSYRFGPRRAADASA